MFARAAGAILSSDTLIKCRVDKKTKLGAQRVTVVTLGGTSSAKVLKVKK